MNYTGIGARKTPSDVLSTMTSIATLLDRQGYTFRSGAADGADSAFEAGVSLITPEIYLPCANFNKSASSFTSPKKEAYLISEKYHPAWNRLSPAAKKLMARNVHQIIGWDMRTLSDFVVCWTADGKASGGTGQALRIAKDCNIPIYNLYNVVDVERLVSERLDV